MAAATVWAVVQIIQAVSWGNHQSPAELVFQSRNEMVNVWTADGGREDQMPGANFDKETVVAVFAGPKTGSGYRIKIMQVVKSEDGKKAVVLYQEKEPEGGATGTKVTYPNHVVRIAKTEGDIKFLDIDSTDGKKFVDALQQSQGQPQPQPAGK